MTTKQRLLDWTERYNTYSVRPAIDVDFLKKSASENASAAFDEKKDRISASNLYKPVVRLACMKMGLPFTEPPVPTRMYFHFLMGHISESYLISLLTSESFFVSKYQEKVLYENYSGHIDFVINDEYLVDVKTMNSGYFTKFVEQPNNARGYLTQMAFYWVALGRKYKPAWICLCKETGRIAFVEAPEMSLLQAISWLDSTILTLGLVKEVGDIGQLYVPSPVLESFKNSHTGKFLIPPSMRGFSLIDCVYDMEVGRNGYDSERSYVKRVLSREERTLRFQNYAAEQESVLY